VALPAHAMKGTANECLAAGMDYYLSKPIDRELLRESLERLLRSHTSAATPREAAAPEMSLRLTATAT
jgi:two-component system, sensor histidine kinase and response regulator